MTRLWPITFFILVTFIFGFCACTKAPPPEPPLDKGVLEEIGRRHVCCGDSCFTSETRFGSRRYTQFKGDGKISISYEEDNTSRGKEYSRIIIASGKFSRTGNDNGQWGDWAATGNKRTARFSLDQPEDKKNGKLKMYEFAALKDENGKWKFVYGLFGPPDAWVGCPSDIGGEPVSVYRPVKKSRFFKVKGEEIWGVEYYPDEIPGSIGPNLEQGTYRIDLDGRIDATINGKIVDIAQRSRIIKIESFSPVLFHRFGGSPVKITIRRIE